jgi:hypothetical protein
VFARFSRIDINGAAEFYRARRGEGHGQMNRVLVVLPLFLMATAAPAQQGHDACARDVVRLCRAVMNDGDTVVLGCLKQHRARLSRACDKVLTDHGQ